jgi:phage portal protein BeeE
MADFLSRVANALGIVTGVGAPVATPSRGPVQAYDTFDLTSVESSAELAEFMRAGHSSKAGRPVTEASAMANATFNRAVTVTAATIGHLPLNLHRRNADGGIEKAKDHPVHRLLRVRPNAAQTPFQFKSYMQGRALLKGDAFAFIVPGVRGPQALWPLDPDRVTVEHGEDFTPTYRYTPKAGAERVYRAGQIMHLRAPWSSDGLRGDGLLKLAKEALGLAEISDEAAARMLRNGSYIGGYCSIPRRFRRRRRRGLRRSSRQTFRAWRTRAAGWWPKRAWRPSRWVRAARMPRGWRSASTRPRKFRASPGCRARC